jgi:hypothetical protein
VRTTEISVVQGVGISPEGPARVLATQFDITDEVIELLWIELVQLGDCLMDTSIVPALAGLTGAAIGGLTSGIAWFAQKTQSRVQLLAQDKGIPVAPAGRRGNHSAIQVHTKRAEFFAARFAEVAENVDGVLVDHLAQLNKCLVWLQINIGNFLPDLLGAGEDFR